MKSFQKFLKEKMSKNNENSARDKEVIRTLPFSVKRKLGLTGFTTALVCFLILFLIIFFGDFFSEKLNPISRFSLSNTTINVNNFMIEKLTNSLDSNDYLSSAVLDVSWNPDFQFLYDGKKYPKTPEIMPIYQLGEINMNGKLTDKFFDALKVGIFSEISLKNGDLYLALGTNDSLCGDKICSAISDKEYKKTVIKKLNELGISLKDYGEGEIGGDNSHRNMFFPFVVDGIPVTSFGIRRGINVTYDIIENSMNIENIDLHDYSYSQAPILSKDEVLADFMLGDKRLKSPELVYSTVNIQGGTFLIPALRFDRDNGGFFVKNLIKN